MIDDPLYWILSLFGAAGYWLLPGQLRGRFLLCLSFVYLATISPVGVALLLLWSLAFYYVTPAISHARPYAFDLLLLWAVLIYLFCLKYLTSLPIFSERLSQFSPEIRFVIPIGISYYTFKLVHYALEKRNSSLPRHTLVQFLNYMYFFPIYTAGPIEKFDHFLANKENKWCRSSITEGITRICYGLIKKFVLIKIFLNIPSIFGKNSDFIMANISAYSSLQIWALLLVTYLTLYLDFSAYSDIAIGTARLFGYKIMENFNYPILANTILDFWRRWHMTLAGWVQSYVYMPLVGLYRRPVLALVSAFIIIGIWHELSITRIVWGLYHVAAIVLYVRWSRSRPRIVASKKARLVKKIGGIGITQLFIVTSMAFLVAKPGQSLYDCFIVLAKLIGIDLPNM